MLYWFHIFAGAGDPDVVPHRYLLQTMYQKVNTEDLKLGMFVADLDRPWIDTPFLLQGFLLEDSEQLQQLRLHCRWVTIDPHRSIGPGFDTPAKKTVNTALPRDRNSGPIPRVLVQRTLTAAPAYTESKAAAAPKLPRTANPSTGSLPVRKKRIATLARVLQPLDSLHHLRLRAGRTETTIQTKPRNPISAACGATCAKV